MNHHRRRDFSLWCIPWPYRADPEGLASGVKTCLILQDDSAGLRVLPALDELGDLFRPFLYLSCYEMARWTSRS